MPNPKRFGITPDDAFLMVGMEFKLTPANIKVFARKPDKSKTPVKQGSDFSFEGTDRIEFEDDNEVLHFFFPKDFAFAESDSAQAGQVVRRFFYSERGKHFLLAGVPWSWLRSQPKGAVVIDPSTAATTTEDVWLEDGDNKNSYDFLIVGNTANYPKKRTVIKFDVASAGVPNGATIVKAQMNLKYYEKANVGGTAWVDRTVQAHQLLVDWDQTQATRDNRLTSTPWNAQYGAIDGTDAKATPESSVLFQENESLPRWKRWDLTGLTRLWLDGSAPNYGVILWATNEDTDGYDLRFHSSEAASVFDQPSLEIIWTQPTRTVYFLKDHLGSVRATVDDIGQVIGYDDYDPWGFILAGRSMATGASTVQGAAKNKFTGKEWDDEFGLNWYYFVGRPYDGEIGRWLRPDPFAVKYPASSPFVYAANNPVLLFDPNGKEIKNSNKMVLSNKQVVSTLKKFDKAVARISGLKSSEFTFQVTGGDRFKKDGKIFSATEKKEVKGSSKISRHLQERGALAVDLSKPENISKDVVKKAAKEVGFGEIKVDYSDGHVHLALPLSEAKKFLKDKTVDKKFVPTFEQKEEPSKKVKDNIQELKEREDEK